MAAKQPRDLTARDVMRTDVVTVGISTPVVEIERVLDAHGIGGVPVTDHAGRIVGVVSVGDLITRYAENGDAEPRRGSAFYQLPTDDFVGEDDHARALPAEVEDTAEELIDDETGSPDEHAALSYTLRADSRDYAIPTDARDTAADVMTPVVHSVPEETPLGKVASTMLNEHIHRVLVTRDDRHVGIVTTFDLLRAIAGPRTGDATRTATR